MNEQEIESDEDLLIKDLITLRGRIEDCLMDIQRGRKLDAQQKAKSSINLVTAMLAELRGEYDHE